MEVALSKEFNWVKELNQVVTESLCSTFGLGFLLFQDKDGGDVDTVHNVRQEIYATEEARRSYEQRGNYDSIAVHKNEAFIETKRALKREKQGNRLYDAYSGHKIKPYEDTHTDHIISGHETHDDRGRVLAGVPTEKLANSEENLVEVGAYANLKKSDFSPEEFADKLPEFIKNKELAIQELEKKKETIVGDDRKSRHERQKCEDKIRKAKEHLKTLKGINPEKVKQKAKRARAAQNAEVNRAYYTNPEFYTKLGSIAVFNGVKLGLQQVVGLIVRELWLDLQAELPCIYNRCKYNFEFKCFFEEIKNTIRIIWQRVKLRFGKWKDVFQESVIHGTLSTIGTTLVNTIFTTGKFWVRIIRETIGSIVKAAKLLIFNPQKFPKAVLIKEVIKILSLGASTFAGLTVQSYLLPLCQFPMGNYIANFLGAVTTGVLTVGLIFFFDHSSFMKKVMKFMEDSKSKYQRILEYYQEVNEILDKQIAEYAKVEFNLNVEDLTYFTDEIYLAGTPEELQSILYKEVQRRNIKLPFTPGDTESVKHWLLKSTAKKGESV